MADHIEHIRLTANVDDYVAGMERARKATRKLAKATNSISTVVCCDTCDKPVVRIPGSSIEYIDSAGTINARCANHAADTRI